MPFKSHVLLHLLVIDEAEQDLVAASPEMRQFPLCLNVQLGWSGALNDDIALNVAIALLGLLLGLMLVKSVDKLQVTKPHV